MARAWSARNDRNAVSTVRPITRQLSRKVSISQCLPLVASNRDAYQAVVAEPIAHADGKQFQSRLSGQIGQLLLRVAGAWSG